MHAKENESDSNDDDDDHEHASDGGLLTPSKKLMARIEGIEGSEKNNQIEAKS